MTITYDHGFPERVKETLDKYIRTFKTPSSSLPDIGLSNLVDIKLPLSEDMPRTSSSKLQRVDDLITFCEQPSMYDMQNFISIVTIPLSTQFSMETLSFLAIVSKVMI
jgi:hypothetical protein